MMVRLEMLSPAYLENVADVAFVEFEIGGRFSGRHLDPEVSLSPPHTRL
jgi:hypothetical protein